MHIQVYQTWDNQPKSCNNIPKLYVRSNFNVTITTEDGTGSFFISVKKHATKSRYRQNRRHYDNICNDSNTDGHIPITSLQCHVFYTTIYFVICSRFNILINNLRFIMSKRSSIYLVALNQPKLGTYLIQYSLQFSFPIDKVSKTSAHCNSLF